ncbi:MAG TPA: DMT family transporter [Rubrivivax sp.]|nr:DMT family transporter [Rubrivivax sp.]
MTDDAAAQQRALGAGLMLVLVWGASFTIQKAAYSAMSPGGFLFGRALLMALCAVLLLRWRRRALWPSLTRREWGQLFACAAAGQALHIGLVTYGIHWSTPFSSALIMALGPVFTLVLLRAIRGTRLHRSQMLGVAAALAGVLLFMSDKLIKADLRASGGDLLMLLSTIVFSLYTIWATPLVARHGGVAVMCWATLLATPMMLLFTAPAAAQAPYGAIDGTIWLAFFWSVLVSAFLGWILWGWINAVRGVARTAPLLYLVPPVAGVIAWLTVGEHFGGVKLLGAVLALGGVVWTQLAPRDAAAGAITG